MARHQYRKKDPMDLIVPIVGLLVFSSIFSPQIRTSIASLLILFFAGLFVIILGAIIWLRVQARKKGTVQESLPPTQAFKEQATFKEPTQITPELLAALEWRRFEILIAAYFQKKGFSAWRNRAGADGGVDILLARPGDQQPCACVQCKAWKTYTVGVKPVRELFGVMAADKIPEGYFVTTGEYTTEALDFAQGKPMILISGRQLLTKLNQLPEADHAAILREITSGDYTTPTCPRCDVKMAERQGSKGSFWGCRNYPRCRQAFNIKS